VRRRSFDAVVRLYDRSRPGYPEQLFDDLVRLSGIPPAGRILEIGPGTGQATLPLARRGFRILAVELGPRTTRFLRARLKPFPNAQVQCLAFENWPVEAESFDLVVAAGSFHWLKPGPAFTRCARALRRQGHIAILYNFREVSGTPILDRLTEVYERYAPHLARPRAPEQRIEIQRRKLAGSGRFGPVTVLRYPWVRPYTAEEYVDLLKTMSDHTILAPQLRRSIFRAVRRAINDHGGVFFRQIVATLFIAPRRGTQIDEARPGTSRSL
jgi:SAM-dependent methyltransferase